MNAARRILVVHLTAAGAEVVSVQPDLVYMQALVGGYIENVHLLGDVHLVCNEQGALGAPPLPVHWVVNGEPIHGDCFLTRSGDVDGEPDYVGFDESDAIELAKILSSKVRASTRRPWAVTIGY